MKSKTVKPGQIFTAVVALAFLTVCTHGIWSLSGQKRDAYFLALSEAWKLRHAEM